MLILVDDEDRENEGDLFVAAERATPAAINFMAAQARGLVSLALTEERMRELGLALIADDSGNQSKFGTAFATPIDAREGVGSGMSAHDRARTIAVAIADATKPGDLIRPGRLQTLRALDGGVLARRGHTEAAVDLARLAGLKPAGVICEIMNDDGTMARRPELEKFAALHDLKILRIADLIDYRRNERRVRRKSETMLPTRKAGAWRLLVYSDDLETTLYVALVKGEISTDYADAGAIAFAMPDRRRIRLGALRLRRTARSCDERDRQGGQRRRGLHVRRRARHRVAQQDTRLCAAGPGPGHGRGQPCAGLRRGHARLQDRRAYPVRPRRARGAPLDQ